MSDQLGRVIGVEGLAIHQCPKCELKFAYRTELDDHIWHDHADFRHEYPATTPPPEPEVVVAAPADSQLHARKRGNLVGWLMPKESHDHDREHTMVAPGQAEFDDDDDRSRGSAGPSVE